MNKARGFVMFVLGAAVGSVATWQYTKKKYERIAQEEIDSVKEIFSKRESAAEVEIVTPEPQTAKVGKPEEKPDITEYAARLEREGYTNYSNVSAGEKKEEQEAMEMKPYVISPEEFGEFEDYERISLSYYADQILADEDDEKVEDVDNVVGLESLTHFGEFEDDSVFVRNDRLKCDYEILLDQRTYSDVIKQRPHQTEV
ncbi:hypothetical protein HLY09_25640 [Enterocloster bolteae]|uniref:hypothetical protein n=1 Tax=Enterocloster bolteae TaxID=208479 RepID=UPI00148E87C6|nr:hypothetical protein [Enterocloster bolteae]QJU22518.1 hypothetical protein HLY09_25640 [Enterocloster bolteae]